jgi:hypothetical protein
MNMLIKKKNIQHIASYLNAFANAMKPADPIEFSDNLSSIKLEFSLLMDENTNGQSSCTW